MFFKPHCCEPGNDEHLEYKKRALGVLEGSGCTVVESGKIASSTILGKKLIGKHYYAIASKATLKKPSELNVPGNKFRDAFGISFEEALEHGLCFNALDAIEELEVDATELERLSRTAKKSVKFGGGFYCCEIKKEEKAIYVFNAFYMSMRSQYVESGKQIKWLIVEFDDETLKWADFRSKVLGKTDPSKADPDSL